MEFVPTVYFYFFIWLKKTLLVYYIIIFKKYLPIITYLLDNPCLSALYKVFLVLVVRTLAKLSMCGLW